ncbi:MAG: translation initiation factor [Chthoniobacterales bacterium]|nr:translation initiation factor [Chthoniobacterales bacterium]
MATEAAPELRTNPFASLDLGPLRDAPAESATRPAPKKEPKERLLLRRETAHRGGKTVLVLEAFSPAWSTAKLEDLLHDLKTALGCGGKTFGRKIEIQGDQPDRLQPLLEARGFTVKRGW